MTILNDRGVPIRTVDEVIADHSGKELFDGQHGPVTKGGDKPPQLPALKDDAGRLQQLLGLLDAIKELVEQTDCITVAVVTVDSGFHVDLKAITVPGSTKGMIARALLQAGDKLFQASMTDVRAPAFQRKP